VTKSSLQCWHSNLFAGFASHVAACLSLESGFGKRRPQKQAFLGFLSHPTWCASRRDLPSLLRKPNIVKALTNVALQNWHSKRFEGFMTHLFAWAFLASGLGKSCPQKHLFAGLAWQASAWASRLGLPSQDLKPITPKVVTNSCGQYGHL